MFEYFVWLAVQSQYTNTSTAAENPTTDFTDNTDKEFPIRAIRVIRVIRGRGFQ